MTRKHDEEVRQAAIAPGRDLRSLLADEAGFVFSLLEA